MSSEVAPSLWVVGRGPSRLVLCRTGAVEHNISANMSRKTEGLEKGSAAEGLCRDIPFSARPARAQMIHPCEQTGEGCRSMSTPLLVADQGISGGPSLTLSRASRPGISPNFLAILILALNRTDSLAYALFWRARQASGTAQGILF